MIIISFALTLWNPILHVIFVTSVGFVFRFGLKSFFGYDVEDDERVHMDRKCKDIGIASLRASLQHSFHIGLGFKFAFHYSLDNSHNTHHISWSLRPYQWISRIIQRCTFAPNGG